MGTYISRFARSRRFFATAVCALLIFSMAVQQTPACSWDYTIWMIRNKDADPLYRFLKDDKAGYIDRLGTIVIKPQFNAFGNSGDEFHDGLLALRVGHGPYADKSGKIALDKDYDGSWDFSEGLAAVLPINGGKWGYMDRTGEFVISPRFDSYPLGLVSSFSDGLAMIDVGGRIGYIDRTGEFVIRPKFVFGADFRDGMARVVTEGPCVYWDDGPCGEAEIVPSGSTQSTSACKFSFIDKSGSVIPGRSYDYARDYSEGLAAVQVGNKWGYIDKKGRTIIAPKYDKAEPFSDGIARVEKDALWGYVDRSGKIVIDFQFNYAEEFSDGLAVVGKWDVKEVDNQEYYYIDKRGMQAFPGKFAFASHFFKGVAHVKLNIRKQICKDDEMDDEGLFAFIDVKGKRIFTYQNCEPEED